MCDEEPIRVRDGSRVLCLNVCFLLPDDFSGDCDDAIKYYLKHKQRKNIKDSLGEPNSPTSSTLTLGTIWQQFLMVLKNGIKSHGFSSIAEYKDDTWKFNN